MQLEFSDLLHCGIREVLRERVSDERIESFLKKYACEVVDCPEEISGMFSSAACFEISSQLKKICTEGSIDFGPAQLADWLAEWFSQESTARANLTVEVGGPGYLNAFAKRDAVARFLEEARSKDDFFARVASDSRLDVDWPSIFSTEKNSDLSALYEQVKSRRSFSRSDLIMALALFCDEELGAEAYFLGLSSRQNVPWYLEKFQQDARQYVEGCGRDFSGFNRLPDEAIFTPLLRVVLGFRGAVERAKRRKRADLLFAAVLELVRGFYSYYNRPEYRALFVDSGDRAWAAEVGAFSGILREMVERGLNLIEFSCDFDEFVLEH